MPKQHTHENISEHECKFEALDVEKWSVSHFDHCTSKKKPPVLLVGSRIN